MNIDINTCLDNINVEFNLSYSYINELFLLIRCILKPTYKNYELQKKNIVKQIYHYFEYKMKINKKVINISKLKQPIQRSTEWYEARYNKITASEIASIIGTDTSHICNSELEKIYKKPAFKNRYELLKTKILKNDVFKGNKYTDWGILFEPIATLIYEHRNNTHIIEFGLIEHPHLEIIAASPDGITKDTSTMIEIKAPYSRKLNGLVPLNYWIQMQLQMETCNLDKCHFVEITTKLCSLEDFNNNNNENNENDIMFTSNLLEKGKIIKCFNDDSKIDYFYPPYDSFRSLKKTNSWIEEKIPYYESIYKNVIIIYWKLEEYSCIEVCRDKGWFKNNYIKFEEFWKEVVYYREHMEEFLLLDNKKEEEKLNKKKKLNKEEFEKYNVLSMIDSDSDDNETNTQTKNTDILNIENKNIEDLSNSTDSFKSLHIDNTTEIVNDLI